MYYKISFYSAVMFSKLLFLFQTPPFFLLSYTDDDKLHLESLLISGCQSSAQTLIHNAYKKKNHYSTVE